MRSRLYSISINICSDRDSGQYSRMGMVGWFSDFFCQCFVFVFTQFTSHSHTVTPQKWWPDRSTTREETNARFFSNLIPTWSHYLEWMNLDGIFCWMEQPPHYFLPSKIESDDDEWRWWWPSKQTETVPANKPVYAPFFDFAFDGWDVRCFCVGKWKIPNRIVESCFCGPSFTRHVTHSLLVSFRFVSIPITHPPCQHFVRCGGNFGMNETSESEPIAPPWNQLTCAGRADYYVWTSFWVVIVIHRRLGTERRNYRYLTRPDPIISSLSITNKRAASGR